MITLSNFLEKVCNLKSIQFVVNLYSVEDGILVDRKWKNIYFPPKYSSTAYPRSRIDRGLYLLPF